MKGECVKGEGIKLRVFTLSPDAGGEGRGEGDHSSPFSLH